MATTIRLKCRQNALQIKALKIVELEVRACDQSWRRKYLLDYAKAFRAYKSVLDSVQVKKQISDASLILIGDYHALPACQKFVAQLLKDRAGAMRRDRPVILALETVFSRDQHILEDWWRGDIIEQELRRRIRFDRDWGYEWDPFYDLLCAARESADGIYGLDCMPREDLRKISVRDRHAAHKIAEIRERYPDAVIVVLIGESHLAPTHLPALVRKQLPSENLLTILQNVDTLYRQASEEHPDAQAVGVDENTICVFNSTPLEKYENYCACLDRWAEERTEELDFAPLVYGLIDGLVRFLDINRYSPHNGTQPKFLIDLLPEVCGTSLDQLRKLLSRKQIAGDTAETIVMRVAERGCAYVPQLNILFVRDIQRLSAAEEASRFVFHACQGFRMRSAIPDAIHSEDVFYSQLLEGALAYLGSRILCESGALREPNRCSSDSLVECEPLHHKRATTHREGYALGTALYDAHVKGRLSRYELRRIFLASLKEDGKSTSLYRRLNERFSDQRKVKVSATSHALL